MACHPAQKPVVLRAAFLPVDAESGSARGTANGEE